MQAAASRALPPAPESAPAVSSAAASANGGTINLNFASAIDATAGADPSSYTVDVDGTEVAVQSAAVSKTGRSVTIVLGQGALRAGAKVTVSFRFAGDDGAEQSGQAAVIAN